MMQPNKYYFPLSLFGSAILLFIMLHHPHGGDLDAIASKQSTIYFTHIPAICALPLMALGILKQFSYFTGSIIAELGRIVFSFSIFCGIVGTICNGLVLPMFLNQAMEFEKLSESTRVIVLYNTTLNRAFEYLFITGSGVSTIILSIANFKTKIFSSWFSWFCLFFFCLLVLLFAIGLDFLTVAGFTIFVLIFSAWCLTASYQLLNIKNYLMNKNE